MNLLVTRNFLELLCHTGSQTLFYRKTVVRLALSNSVKAKKSCLELNLIDISTPIPSCHNPLLNSLRLIDLSQRSYYLGSGHLALIKASESEPQIVERGRISSIVYDVEVLM